MEFVFIKKNVWLKWRTNRKELVGYKYLFYMGFVIFVSHDIEEVIDKSDTVTMLRDGILTATLKKQEFSETKLET